MTARLSIIPAGAVTDPNIEPRDLQVLCLLGRHTDKLGWCMRSQVKMAGELSCGRATLQRSLERLVEAGWVQKKQRGVPEGEAPGHPSASYAYRVILDREDFAFDAARDRGEDETASHVSNDGDASLAYASDAEIPGEGVPTDGHPGAHPERARGAHPYAGTKNDPLERPHLERDVADDARGRPVTQTQAYELAEQLLVIAGHDRGFWPPGWCGAPMRVQTWLANNWPPEIILAATRACVARKAGPPAYSVQFFEKAIAEEVARQAAPLPIVEVRPVETIRTTHHAGHQGNGNIVQAADRLVEHMRSFDDDGRGAAAEDLRGGAVPPPVRLLPQG